MTVQSALYGAFIWLIAGNALASAADPKVMLKLLQEETPLQLSFCKTLGYEKTSKINFMQQTQQSVVREDNLYKALQLLAQSGCSELVRPYTCAIYAPQLTKPYGALPPCQSLCKRTKQQCRSIMRFFKTSVNFFCDYLPQPNKKQGCIDYEHSDEDGVVKKVVKGTPTAITKAWKIPERLMQL